MVAMAVFLVRVRVVLVVGMFRRLALAPVALTAALRAVDPSVVGLVTVAVRSVAVLSAAA
ncbi:hypothetical protein BN973_00979 [Mycobacterium triplex]|uniref:Uncharacterized protein n=2 Tax=Mycobacterium triplex TaxID=47839 RepID=A0A024JSS6_9MYCO|nr:hypothetical protein BN973_00979 [Mycobacterium triplex]